MIDDSFIILILVYASSDPVNWTFLATIEFVFEKNILVFSPFVRSYTTNCWDTKEKCCEVSTAVGKIFRQVRKLYLLKVYKQMLVHVPSTSKYRTKTKMFWLIQSITQFIVNVLDAWEYWNFLSEVRPNKKKCYDVFPEKWVN